MPKYKTDPKVDASLKENDKWAKEFVLLRRILLESGLEEVWKWYKPVYAYDGHNVIAVFRMKESCGLGFFKGGIMKDPDGLLIKPGQHAEVGRQVRFTSVKEIKEKEKSLRAYIQQAIEIEKAGLKVPTKPVSALKMPDELKKILHDDPTFKKAFEKLTPGRQRGYIFFFSGAKQSATRDSRIEKCRPKILAGKGLQE